MKIRLKIKKILFAIMLATSVTSSVAMMEGGEAAKESGKEYLTQQQEHVFEATQTRRREEELLENNSHFVEQQNEKSALGLTKDNRVNTPVKWDSSVKEPWPVKMPLGFSEVDRDLLEQDLQKVTPEKLKHYAAASFSLTHPPSKRTQDMMRKWMAKGVTIDPDFVAEATAIRKDAEQKTTVAKRLEQQAQEAFDSLEEEHHYTAALDRWYQFLEVATQARDAWIKTASMHQQIPGRHWGEKLQETWSSKVESGKARLLQVQQDFLQEIQKTCREGVALIEEFRIKGIALMEGKKYNEAARLSGIYEKIIIAQRTINYSLVPGELLKEVALKKELGLESVKAAMLQAKINYQEMMSSKEMESDEEGRTTNDSLVASSLPSQHKHFGDRSEEEKRKQLFQQRAVALSKYAHETLNIIYNCFSIFTSGGEFADETDTNDLSAAYDQVETAAWVLQVFQEKIASGEHSASWQQQKQEVAISDLEQRIQEAHDIAARIRNEEIYEHDGNMNEILGALQKAKEEYEYSQQHEE